MRHNKKVAICFSGFPQVSYAGENLKQVLTKCFGDFDSFWYISNENELDKIVQYFTPTRLLIEPDVLIDTARFPTDYYLKTGLQAFLQQIHGWKKSNEMREVFESQSGTHYDFVVRCRPDILFRAHLPVLDQFDPAAITVPAFHPWGGYNDRFAIGNVENMNKLMVFFDYIVENPWCLASSGAEISLKKYLDWHQIPICESRRIGFDRVRNHDGEYVIQRDC